MSLHYVRQIENLKPLFENIDHADVKSAVGTVSMEEFIREMFAMPRWVDWLMGARKWIAKPLGLEHPDPPDGEKYSWVIDEVPMKPGEKLHFFNVQMAEPERYWVGEIDEDKHLRAWLVVVVEPINPDIELSGPPKKKFHAATIVKYKNWAGPVYFNLIRPLHHLILWHMAKRGARG